MERIAGPRTCAYRFPGHFRNALEKFKALSFEGLERELCMAMPRPSLGGHVIGVRDTVKIVVASDFDAAIMDQARDYLRDFFWHWPGILYGKSLVKEFGFAFLETPEYYLGPLYEILPPDIAIESFANYHLRSLFDPRLHRDKDMIEAGRILLRFSAPEEAAMFTMKLLEAAPKKTMRLLSNMKGELNICEYPYRRYELRDLREEVNYLLPRPYLL